MKVEYTTYGLQINPETGHPNDHQVDVKLMFGDRGCKRVEKQPNGFFKWFAEFHPNCGWDKKEKGVEDTFEKAFRRAEDAFHINT